MTPGSPDRLELTLIKFDAFKNPEIFEKGICCYLTIILAIVARDNQSTVLCRCVPVLHLPGQNRGMPSCHHV